MAIDLRALSNTELGMAFGMCIQSTPGTTPTGALALIADELKRRGSFGDCMLGLGVERARAVSMLINVDRVRARKAAQ